MATEKQTEANRRNAQKSTGPKTEAGKRASALNAYTHGLTAQTLLLTAEQAEVRKKFVDSIVADLKPVGAMEGSLARSIADTRFRINRAVAIEDNIFGYDTWDRENRTDGDFDDIDRALCDIRIFFSDPKRFDLLTIYEARLQRKAREELKQLRELQTTRKAEEEKARQSAAAPPVAGKAKAAGAAARPIESTAPTPDGPPLWGPQREIGFHYSDAEIPPVAAQPALPPTAEGDVS